MTLSGSNDVAVFIDYENLYYSISQSYIGFPNLEQIIEAAEKYGRVASCQAFADWGQFERSLSFLLRAGIQPVFCPSVSTDPNQLQEKKSSVDPTICIHAMKLLYTYPNISTLLLVSGDRDFIPLLMEARQMGRKVVVLGVGRSISSDLAALADDVILYQDIVEGLMPKELRADTIRIKRTEDPYPLLLAVIKEARKQNKPTTFGYLKLRMKDRMEGFDETTLEDRNGRKFKRFKDFILEAVNRGIVKLHTSGTANEVFLPTESVSRGNQIGRASDSSPSAESTNPKTKKGNGHFILPPVDLVKIVERILNESKRKLAFTRIKQALTELKKQRRLASTHSEIDTALKGCIHYELLEGEKVKGVMQYNLFENWEAKLDELNRLPKVLD